MSENAWLPIIKYAGFWDVPREVVVEYNGTLYLFESLFDEESDDYLDFDVYRIPMELRDRLNKISFAEWLELVCNPGARVGQIPVTRVKFDEETRRHFLHSDAFRELGIA